MTAILPLLLKATLLLLLGLALMPLLRHRSAGLRHAVLAGTLSAALLLPVLSSALPQVSAPVLAPAPFVGSAAPATPLVPKGPARDPNNATVGDSPVPVAASRPVRLPLATIWAVGAGVFLLAFGVGVLRTHRITRKAVVLQDAPWRHDLETVRHELDIQPGVGLLLTDAVAVPALSSIRRPVILLPFAARAWTQDRRRVVLLHELTHLRRGDGIVEYLTRVAVAVYWFHPLAWLAARRLRLERELACDEAVVRRHVGALDYADHLVEIAASVSRQRLQPALAMAQRGALERRVRAILSLPASRPPMRRIVKVALAGGVTLLVLAVSAMRPVPRASQAGVADTLEMPITPDRHLSWIGALAPGDTFTVRAAMGSIAIDTSEDRSQVLVTVLRRAGPRGLNADTRFGVIRSAGRLAVCSIHFHRGHRVAPCTADEDWGRGSVDDNQVNFQITVPRGVHVTAMTGLGEVKVLHMHGDVRATTGAGSAYVETDGAASLEALSGDMHLILRDGGRPGPVVLHGMHAAINVSLPAGSGANLDARTGRGSIEVDGKELGDRMSPSAFRGAIGPGGRTVTASLEKGDIRIGRP